MIFPIKKISVVEIGLPFVGNKNYFVENIAGLSHANETCISFTRWDDPEVVQNLEVGILIVPLILKDQIVDYKSKAIVFSLNPKCTFIEIIAKNHNNSFELVPVKPEIDKTSIISEKAFIESEVRIGKNCKIYPNTSVFNSVVIGDNCDIQSNSVIGGVGLGDVYNDGKYNKFVHLGSVIIHNNVSIGTNVSIMRGMLEETIIGEGTKIGNNVNIGHNVNIGKNCYISSGATIGGASKIGDNCWISIGATLNDHVNVGTNTKIGTGAVLIRDAMENSFYLGNPAKKISERFD